ncbi:BMP family lipoprotein [Enterococcus sp. CSURQ0835]|uniref:BMP family lipoprotein n=1 Tax=Enterococcus sp. CSURQ0835 TaxID=2681394 RepID=UPI00135B5472|nr:BMP family ABC transporter substrate-binding protein [Enterococcus sp. CSURQ0835]
MKKFFLGVVTATLFILLAGCSTSNGKTIQHQKVKIALILGFGGVDDRAFNQSGWEGLDAWGKKHGLKKNQDYLYIETNEPQDNMTNVNKAVENGFNTIINLSYLQAEEIKEAAKKNPQLNFALVDGSIKGMKNVTSATFKDHESAYLVGLAAAYTTKTNQVGFIGGMEGPVIARFEKGFAAGVKAGGAALHKEIKVDRQYAASFDSPDKGKAIAAAMYENGADAIYQAAGITGAGVFQEAKARNENQIADAKVWVIGVDRDQVAEGEYVAKDGQKSNFTLTSTKKNVGTVVEKIAQAAKAHHFPGGKEVVVGLKEKGVEVTRGNLSAEAYQAVQQAQAEIISGKLIVPEK